ncbi:MAG: VCBS repeat-containing protein [Chitinophagales bacterium]
MSNFTMGCDFADINNDGYMDLFAADMLPEDNHRQKMLKGPAKYNAYQLAVQYGYYHQNMHNVLQLNTVKGYFSDIAFSAGVAMTDWSWSPLFADFDNDGLQDLYVTNGYRRDFTDMDFLHYTYSDAQQKANDAGEKLNTYQMVQEMPSVKTSNYMFRNVSGLAFEQVQNNWGLNIPSFSNGAAYADLDLDGDLDIIVNNINDTAFIFQNNCSSRYRNKWITVKLKGEEKNTYGIGAKVIVRAGDKIYTRFVMPVHGFQSTSDATLTIGVGNADSLQLDVYFPSGRYIHYPLIHSCTYIIVPEKAAEKNEPKQDEKAPFFTDITDKTIQYKSTEETYEDFTREPLLPYKLSSVGPCADMADVNGDGRKDIFIGGAANKKGILFLQDETGFFIPQKGGPWDADAGCADSDVLFFDADNDGDPDLFVTSGGNTYPDGSTQYSNRLYINDGKGNFSAYTLLLEQFLEPATSVSAADYDRDGDIDLAIGLGYTPGKFPLGNGVRILRNGGEEGFYDVTNTIHASFNSAGMISKVQWADMNGDGREELITLGEWNSIHIYEMRKGMLMDRTAQYGLDHTAGLWNTCTLSDIDGDGDMDIIAGNFGTNTQWQASAEQPLTVYSGDLDNNGSIDPIISYYYTDGVSHPLPSRDDIIDAVPDFKKKFIYYADYADISTSDLIADTSELLKANTLRSAVFMNNGDEPWEMMPLPEQAQWYPVYAICASDLNGDGNIDILLAGNNYTVRPELGRQDAGTGTLLLGDGKGNFTCIPADTGSPFIQGEVRDIFFLDSEIICILRKNDAVNVLQLNK